MSEHRNSYVPESEGGIKPQEQKQNARIEYFDALKAVSMLLVVFCHFVLLPQESMVGNVVMSFAWAAVPCFMMTTGALMHRANRFDWRKYLKKLAKTYLVLCTWRVLYLIVFLKMKGLHFSAKPVLEYTFLFRDLDGVDTGVMWYMIAYLVVMFLYPVTWFLFQDKDNGRKILAFVTVLALAAGILLPSIDRIDSQMAALMQTDPININGISRILPFTNYGNMIFYFLIGAFLFLYVHQNRFLSSRIVPVVLMALGTAGMVLAKFLDAGTFRWEGIYISGGYSRLMTVFMAVGLYLLFAVYPFKRVNHILAVGIGKYTMGIFYMHYIMLCILAQYVYPRLQDYYSFGANCIKTAVICAVCVLLTVILRKIPLLRELVK